MTRGRFAVDRGVFEHHVLAGEPYTRIQAWLWLLSEAAFQDRAISVAGKTVPLKRGQACHSVRFMSTKWGWSVGKVHRFLDRLKTETMIGTESGTGQLVITICNYDSYQPATRASGTPSGTKNGTAAEQQRNKEEYLNKEIDSSPDGDDGQAPADPKKKLFDDILPWLAQTYSKQTSKFRPLLGKWLADAPGGAEQVLQICLEAQRENVADPVGWITKALQTATPKPLFDLDAYARGEPQRD